MSVDKQPINTIEGYLGPDFQFKLFWQLLTEYEFAEHVLPFLSLEYFDDPNMKKLFLIVKDYHVEHNIVPNIPNKSISLAITKHFNGRNAIEEEIIMTKVREIEEWHNQVLNRLKVYDGETVQREANMFVKQQEFRKLAENILRQVKNGQIKDGRSLFDIEENFQRISRIGDSDNYGIDAFDDIDSALVSEFRETIPTGIIDLDELMGGGLGKGEIGIILAAPGTGKTTSLTKIANSAYNHGANVLQIIFEDKDKEIQRKHCAIWSKVPLSDINENTAELVKSMALEIKSKHNNQLKIVKFAQDSTTIIDIKNFIIKYQKKYGIKFDIVILDYLDCLESHKKNTDAHESEFAIVKVFESMASEFNIPMWSALQGNRSSTDSEWVDLSQMGGNIKRAHKAHFIMSIAKTPEQKQSGLANLSVLKARFAADGHRFKNAIFNNNTLEIRITDAITAKKRTLKEVDEEEMAKLQQKVEAIQKDVTNFDIKPIQIGISEKGIEKNTQREIISIEQKNNVNNFFDGM